MLRNLLAKVMWVGRATIFLVGLSVILAVLFGVASAAFAGNGDAWRLGRINVATSITKLGGEAGVNGPMLRLINNDAGTDDTALELQVQPGEAPLKVNSATRVDSLNADHVDGKHASEIGVNGLVRVEADSVDNSVSPKQVTAVCPSGKVLIGTGFDIFGGKTPAPPSDPVFTHVITDFVIPGTTSVTVAAYEDGALPSSTTWHVKAIAICATAP